MKKTICLLMMLFIMIFSVAGCKKKSEEPTTPVKTAEQLEAEAEKEIDESNMEEELGNLEKEIETDLSTE